MTNERDVRSGAVSHELYATAIKQARVEILIQVFVVLAFVCSWAVLGFPRRMAWTVGIVAPGVVATAYDIRRWLSLRRAHPEEAYRRQERRGDRERGVLRSRYTVLMSLGLFAVWWLVGR